MSNHDDPGNDVLRAAARLTRWASRYASFDIPVAQARLLSLLDDWGPVRVSELAEIDHSSQPTTTAGVHRLEAQGWARRDPDPSDARATLVSVTPAGHEALAEVRRARAAVLAPALGSLDERDLTRLRDAVVVIEDLLARAAAPHHSPVHSPAPIREEA